MLGRIWCDECDILEDELAARTAEANEKRITETVENLIARLGQSAFQRVRDVLLIGP